MRENILLFSNAYHAFILNEIEYASRSFKRVVLLCPYHQELDKVCKRMKNVEYLYEECDYRINLKNLVLALTVFDRVALKQILLAFKNKKITRSYLYIIFSYMLSTVILKKVMKKIISESGEWIALSLWFAQTAYAFSRIKGNYKELKIFSLAHSFEVDDKKNKYINYSFKKMCHDNLENIFFISRNVMEEYIQNHVKKQFWRDDILSVYYLGTIKKQQGDCQMSVDGKFRLVSCSHCIEVKRIDLIIEALGHIEDIEIEWIHIGDGKLFNSLKKQAESLKRDNIRIKWLGKKNNDFVHQFFVTNAVDAFINTSFSEGIPVSLMEAMAYGIPVIATDVGGNSEIVFNDINGFLLSENPEAKEVAASIRKLFNMSTDNRKNLRKNSAEIFERSFNADKLRPEFYSLLKGKKEIV
ncbi:glycosyltransferase Gtf1 [Lachnospiraceae bacterium]|nr:glycosyltransferase Gtf1 [Lachnospiraceae bacterium]